jgi:hypothetical protein
MSRDRFDVLERFAPLLEAPEPSFESFLRRRDRKQRNRRIGAAVLGIALALVTVAGLIRTFRTVERPADEPTPAPKPEGIFADVAGWITYRYDRHEGPVGIWAVDPTRPNDPEARIQLSDRPATPLAWSSDGSKLLISREPGLFVLNADGTETRLVINPASVGRYISAGGSFSPDGSEVVFATTRGMYTVAADGGTPRLLSEGGGNPTFSPDGTKIAYFDFHDKTGNTLRVMNVDGTGDRVVLDSQAVHCFLRPVLLRPAWFPDGTKIAFSCNGIQVVGADGSDLTTLIPGSGPYWAPDGSRIAFNVRVPRPLTQRGGQNERRLVVAHADGTHVQVFEHPALAGPWNPLLVSVPDEPNPSGSSIAPLFYAIALVVMVGVPVGLRARGKSAWRR